MADTFGVLPRKRNAESGRADRQKDVSSSRGWSVGIHRVLTTEALGPLPYDKVVAAYDAARRYPELFDGIACGCGCTVGKHATHRSLLVCYETMQPTGCVACQDEAQLVAKLAKQGNTLAKIRAAVDKEFG